MRISISFAAILAFAVVAIAAPAPAPEQHNDLVNREPLGTSWPPGRPWRHAQAQQAEDSSEQPAATLDADADADVTTAPVDEAAQDVVADDESRGNGHGNGHAYGHGHGNGNAPAKDWGSWGGGMNNAWKKDLPPQAHGHGPPDGGPPGLEGGRGPPGGGPAKDWGSWGGGMNNAWKKDLPPQAQGHGKGHAYGRPNADWVIGNGWKKRDAGPAHGATAPKPAKDFTNPGNTGFKKRGRGGNGHGRFGDDDADVDVSDNDDGPGHHGGGPPFGLGGPHQGKGWQVGHGWKRAEEEKEKRLFGGGGGGNKRPSQKQPTHQQQQQQQQEPVVGVTTGAVEAVVAPVVEVAPAPASDWNRMKSWKKDVGAHHEHEGPHHH
ncbi:unnamed protein product [Tilletia controversa]|nr:unnamed protein product [Tilletia controversa]